MQHPACRGACGCMDPERWLRALVVTEPRSLRAFEAVAGSLGVDVDGMDWFGVFRSSLGSSPLDTAGLTFDRFREAGPDLAAVIPIALASDTLSIATMEVIDNTIMVVVPGAMEAGLSNILFWGSLAFSLVVAGLFAFPVNRRLIARGKGHTAVHETGIHGGPPTRVVAIAAAVAFVFGTWVLAAEAFARW